MEVDAKGGIIDSAAVYPAIHYIIKFYSISVAIGAVVYCAVVYCNILYGK